MLAIPIINLCLWVGTRRLVVTYRSVMMHGNKRSADTQVFVTRKAIGTYLLHVEQKHDEEDGDHPQNLRWKQLQCIKEHDYAILTSKERDETAKSAQTATYWSEDIAQAWKHAHSGMMIARVLESGPVFVLSIPNVGITIGIFYCAVLSSFLSSRFFKCSTTR